MGFSKLFAAGLFCMLGTSLAAQSLPFREGDPFPLLSFPALGGDRPTSLADFRGKKLVLHVFASW